MFAIVSALLRFHFGSDRVHDLVGQLVRHLRDRIDAAQSFVIGVDHFPGLAIPITPQPILAPALPTG